MHLLHLASCLYAVGSMEHAATATCLVCNLSRMQPVSYMHEQRVSYMQHRPMSCMHIRCTRKLCRLSTCLAVETREGGARLLVSRQEKEQLPCCCLTSSYLAAVLRLASTCLACMRTSIVSRANKASTRQLRHLGSKMWETRQGTHRRFSISISARHMRIRVSNRSLCLVSRGSLL